MQSSYTSLAYIGRAAREKILEQWKNNWQQNKNKGKHYTKICKGSHFSSLKAPKDKYPKRLQSAFIQLRLGKGYFKSFTKVIGEDEEGRFFRECRALEDSSSSSKCLCISFLSSQYSLHFSKRCVGVYTTV